jgi:DNA-binding response OmpR family regulator
MNKILIVEDDQIVANIYRNKFSIEGFQVEVALDGNVGLELMRSFRPDAVILDLVLPKITGVEVMKKIRSEPCFEKVPVIVLSNTYLTGMLQEAWKAGATKCLSKANCTPKQVIEIVRSELSENGKPTGGSVTVPSNTPSAKNHTAHTASVADAKFQGDLQKTFIESLPATLSTLRVLLQGTIKAENEAARLKQLNELSRRMHSLSANAGITGMIQIAQMAEAVEALLKELYEKPKNITASTLRTVATAIDFLGVLFNRGIAPENQEIPEANILVIDDEAISRRAVTYALEKAKLKCIGVEDPVAAYKMLSEKKIDLIFLDVDMPGMTGFELCTKLRTLPAHKKTPVVFVTSLNDFDNRTNSTMSGGTDFIAKPFLFIELAVKALVYVLRGRFEAAKKG